MTYLAPALNLSVAGLAFIGAFYWWKASRVALLTRPDWSGDAEINRLSREADLLHSLTEAGRLNAIGARWTALAALVAASSAVLSAVGL